MAEVRWTPQSLNDLESAAEFIARDSPHYAALFIMDVFRSVEHLSEFPQFGRMVPEVGNPDVREILFGNYRIVYRVTKGIIDIITVYHSARLLDPSRFP